LLCLAIVVGALVVVGFLELRSSRLANAKKRALAAANENNQKSDPALERGLIADRLREFHELAVKRLKEDHEEAMQLYQQQKANYDKDLEVYRMAKAENDALKKLNLARALRDEKKSPGAEQHFRDVIKEHPTTQAAKDAKILLDGGQVALRELLPDPVPSTAPVEPRLELPPPPW
jgi:tetratricopeptide (TPR) repeat protein